MSLSHSLAHTHTHTRTNEVNEDECGGTVLLTSCVSNCGPVLQGHGAKTSRERTEIDLMKRNCETVMRLGGESAKRGVNHN